MATTHRGPARAVIAGVSLLALVAGVDYLYEHETVVGTTGDQAAVAAQAPSGSAAGSSLASTPEPTTASRARTTRAS